MKPFNLEAFKAGQKACLIEGKWFRYGFTTSEGRICVEYEAALPLCDKVQVYHLETLKKAHMASRHQALIDAYDPEDTWQFCKQTTYYGTDWETCTGTPEWNEDEQYRIHPHNDLIKAQRNGAIIEKWVEANRPCWFTCYGEPDWDERAAYRVMPEEEKTAAFMRGYTQTLKTLNKRHNRKTKPKTKTVYEWMVNDNGWYITDLLWSETEAYDLFKDKEYKKTGRSWEVEA